MAEFAIKTASIATFPLLPVLAAQGRYVRKHTPRLPAARGATSGSSGEHPASARLLVLGESTVAGVGAPTHHAALTGQLAAALAPRLTRTIHWQAVGKRGATAATTRTELLQRVPAQPYDIIVLALGVNNVLQRQSATVWASDLRLLIAALREGLAPARIFIAAVPPLGQFPALPQPLRSVLGLKAALLNRAARRVAAGERGVTHLQVRLAPTVDFFAADRFHPSPAGYARWAQALADPIAQALTASRRHASA